MQMPRRGAIVRELAAACLLLVAFAGAAPAESPTQPRIRVGIDSAYPPFQWLEKDRTPRGFDVDLMRAVAEAAGLQVEVRGGPWEEIREELEAGDLDAAPGAVWTPARMDVLEFSIPTYAGGFSIFVPDDSAIRSLADLKGAAVAIERASSIDDRSPSLLPSSRPVRTTTPLEALRLVAGGEADAAILRLMQGLYLIREHDLDDLRSIGETVLPVTARIAVSEGRGELLSRLNDGLYTVRENGSYDALYDRWFGVLQPTGVLQSGAGRALVVAIGAIVLLLLASLTWSRTLRRQVAARTLALQASEAESRRLERQLLQSQKMEALGRLAGGVAHDFDNVLTTIIGNAGLALDGVEPDSRQGRVLDAIRRAGRTGAELTRQLLAFARGDSTRPRDLTWLEVFGDAREMLQRLIGSQIALRFEAEPGLWPMRLDQTQALQVVMNLVINGRDAIRGSGRIEVRAENVPAPDADGVRLSVQDDGEGMDVATRERIFEPFFTTKSLGRGTGLGLSTVYGIAERWGGRVSVDSELGSGSTFHVWLPRSAGPAGADAPAPALADAKRAKTVLLVEDDADVRHVAGIMLRSLAYEVVEAPDAESALALLSERGDIELLVTDVELPGARGDELARRALASEPALRVLFTSGLSRDLEVPAEARVGFLPKPFGREELSEALEALLGA